MPGCIVSETTARLLSIGNRRLRATPVITSTFENVSDIGVCLGLSLGPPAIAGVRSKQGALQKDSFLMPWIAPKSAASYPVIWGGITKDYKYPFGDVVEIPN